jgi:hypothetical protein
MLCFLKAYKFLSFYGNEIFSDDQLPRHEVKIQLLDSPGSINPVPGGNILENVGFLSVVFFSFRLLNIILAAVILNLPLTFIARVSLSFGVIIYVMFYESL